MVSFSALELFGASAATYVLGRLCYWLGNYSLPAETVQRRYKTQTKNCWAIVTGCTSGIGEEFALELARQHFNLILVSRSRTKLASMSEYIEGSYDVNVKYIAVDLEDFPNSTYTAQNFLDEVQGHVGDGDICLLVCNAGMSDLARHFTDIPLERNISLIRLNTIANVSLIQTLMPRLILGNQGSNLKTRPLSGIIVVGAVNGVFPAPIFGVSSGNKHFLRGFVRAVRQEFEGKITMLLAHPAAVHSNILTTKAVYGIAPKTFVKNILYDFAKGRMESYGCFIHEIVVNFMILFMNQRMRGLTFLNALHHFNDVLNRPINDAAIEVKLSKVSKLE